MIKGAPAASIIKGVAVPMAVMATPAACWPGVVTCIDKTSKKSD